ncbi:ParB/RepB/Spo0J family partition protein [Candidatus Puniceispirillum sp.]|nr:ParB/RepB/Spo0J family partition protein [Candidatus Puniceispirillum sp.]
MSSKAPVNKMPAKKNSAKKGPERGLGRGLSSLLGDQGVAMATGMSGVTTASSNVSDILQKSDKIGVMSSSGLREVPVEWINVGPWQPRRRFDRLALDELAASIRKNGIVQPILLRPHPDYKSRFQLVAGERRWRAAQLANTHKVPAIIRDLTTAECYEIALVENIQRSDLSVIEEAQGYQKLLDTHRYTQEQLSGIIGKSRSHIANILRLLLLPEPVQTLLLERKITMGQARPLIGHKQPEMLAKTIVMKGLSARQAEALAKQDAVSTKKMRKEATKSSDIRALEKQAADKLGLDFNIDWDEVKERGKITIDCQSLDQVTDLLDRLGIR